MEFELGPCPADEMVAWTKIARRIVVECKELADDESITEARLARWCELLDAWFDTAREAQREGHEFRWSTKMDPELAEFLLHGIDQVLSTPRLEGWVTTDEADTHRASTAMVVLAFTDALWAEGAGCQHFADQILASLGHRINV